MVDRSTAWLWGSDGVLVDTEGLYFKATREVLATVGVELDEALCLQPFLREGGIVRGKQSTGSRASESW